MRLLVKSLFFLVALGCTTLGYAVINVGIGKTEITPPVGTPSAGYKEYKGAAMEGVHDPLFAIALFIDNGEKQIALVSVDNLGFTYEMVQQVIAQVHRVPELKNCDIYIGSSHTHAGGGAFLNIPGIGEYLAGPYNPEVTQLYVKKTAEAIIHAGSNTSAVKMGIGYGKAKHLSKYRGRWPEEATALQDVAVIKVTKLDGTALAVLFNYPVHPTLLKSDNRLFSSDFVGYARDHLHALLGGDVQSLYFNGAQGDIMPLITNEEDRFASCKSLGGSLAETVKEIYDRVETRDILDITTEKISYSFKPETTPFGLTLPLDAYKTEINLIILNKVHAFITIPGELSLLYDQHLKKLGNQLGYVHTSIFGLTNDAHGYIILPASWRHKTFESRLSFGGENYGELTAHRAELLLENNAPLK